MVTLRDAGSARVLVLSLHAQARRGCRHVPCGAAETFPELLEHGRYATQLRRFRDYYERGLLHISLFDDLQDDAQKFFDGVVGFLDLPMVTLEDDVLGARLPASKARLVPVARAARSSADWVRRHDGAKLVGRVKRSRLVQRVLYEPLGDDVPTMSPEDEAYIRERLADEVAGVEHEFGVPVQSRWGW